MEGQVEIRYLIVMGLMFGFFPVEEHANSTYLSPSGPMSPPARKKSVTLRVEDIGGHLLVPPGAPTNSSSSETLTDQVCSNFMVNHQWQYCSKPCINLRAIQNKSLKTAKKRHSSITSEASEEESEEEDIKKPSETLSATNCKRIHRI
jgi:hypothetical protein